MCPAEFFFLAVGEASAKDLLSVIIKENLSCKFLPLLFINSRVCSKFERLPDVLIDFVSD
jgi:hypothetical protein